MAEVLAEAKGVPELAKERDLTAFGRTAAAWEASSQSAAEALASRLYSRLPNWALDPGPGEH
jgi:hypothetical protein